MGGLQWWSLSCFSFHFKEKKKINLFVLLQTFLRMEMKVEMLMQPIPHSLQENV